VGYLVKAVVGFGVFIGGLILFNVKLVQLMEIGTCGSGNTPYVVRNPCPAGTGTSILLLMAGIFAALIGAFMFALRGDPPWRRRRAGGVSTFATLWGIAFTGTGVTALAAGLTDQELGQGGELAGYIVGGTFLVMGVPALLVALGSLVSGLRSRDESAMSAGAYAGSPMGDGASAMFESLRSAASRSAYADPPGGFGAPASPARQGDRIAKLQTLAELRRSGALTEQEFEREKARLLGEP
jgi:hypothetical protein